MQVDSSTPLNTIVTAYPDASRILLRYGLDFCCGGKQTLAEACAGASLELDKVLSEVTATQKQPASTRWDEVAPHLLIEHILEVYHAPLTEELEQLKTMADKVNRVHGSKDPKRLADLAETVAQLGHELIPHMQKEEMILFPWILEGRQPPPEAPIEVMQYEHDVAAKLLSTLKTLTNEFTPPAGACNTWRTLYARLQTFDSDLRHHIHLENNILFPGALK